MRGKGAEAWGALQNPLARRGGASNAPWGQAAGGKALPSSHSTADDGGDRTFALLGMGFALRSGRARSPRLVPKRIARRPQERGASADSIPDPKSPYSVLSYNFL